MVITDFNMPGMNGIQLAYFIKEKYPTTHVVLMTGDEKEVILFKIKDSAVDQALSKPFTLTEMDVTIQGLYSRKSKNLPEYLKVLSQPAEFIKPAQLLPKIQYF